MTTDSRGLDYTAPDYVETITKIWPPDESADDFFKGSKDQKAANRWYSSVEDQPLAYADPFPFLRLREDLRRNVLEYVLGASWRGVQDVGKHTWHPDNPDGHEAPKRVTFSAVASLRTLTFHASSIKAVCRAVAIDVRVLEKTVAKPSAWLQGLWHVTTSASRALALENCRMRALVAGRANLAADMFDRVERYDEGPQTEIKCPAGWSKRRIEGVEYLRQTAEGREEDGEDVGDQALAWAHVRYKTAERENNIPYVDNEFLEGLKRQTFDGFVTRFRQHRWTLLARSVRLNYVGGYSRQDRSGGPGAIDVDALETNLAAFFGAERMRSAPWIQEWCNRGAHPLDETNMRNIRHWKAHDESEPPVTRLRDVKNARGRSMLQVSDYIDLTLNARWESTWPDYRYYWTHDHMLSAAVMDISLVNADTWEQDGGWYNFFDPVTVRCRSGVVAYGGGNVTFKIKTYSEWDEPKTLDTAILFVPILEGVFHAQISCSFVGLS